MKNKLTIRISNEIGNQLFMYASSYAIAKKLNRILYVDDETAFLSKKNISKYGLDNFAITSEIASNRNKFLGVTGYLKRKLLKKINIFISSKKIYTEPKNSEKITKYNDDIFNLNFSKNVYLEGYFETEKYFEDIKDKIFDEFTFLDSKIYKKSPYYEILNEKNSVSICLRQNRFIEGKKRNNHQNQQKSNQFKNEQITYINKSIDYIKGKIERPNFYLWSNDLDSLDTSLFNTKINKIIHDKEILLHVDKRALDLFLISQCNHHIVIPSSFNWWGVWLSQKSNNIILRPSDNFFRYFKVNNLDFWPNKWLVINE